LYLDHAVVSSLPRSAVESALARTACLERLTFRAEALRDCKWAPRLSMLVDETIIK
jgi:hypothetical protein